MHDRAPTPRPSASANPTGEAARELENWHRPAPEDELLSDMQDVTQLSYDQLDDEFRAFEADAVEAYIQELDDESAFRDVVYEAWMDGECGN